MLATGSDGGDNGRVSPTLVSTEIVDDPERCYRILLSRDARFDGWFFVAVRTTGIFCRPSCPATTPKRANVTFVRTAAAAQRGGYRACRRCRPDTAPGSPEWNVRADLAGRAMALVNDGLVDREGVGGLARRLAVSERHLHRVLVTELGAGPLALARARRAHTARVLIETTSLPFTDVAFAAGYASIRQFNDSIREAFGASPTVLRSDRRRGLRRGRAAASAHAGDRGTGDRGTEASAADIALDLRLAVRQPFAGDEVVRFLAARAVPGVEVVDEAGTYHRVLALPHGPAIVSMRPEADHVATRLRLTDLRDLAPAVERCRRLFDLDADPRAIDDHLGADPFLAPRVAAVPGRRCPGVVDGTEALVRAIVGQQVSVAGARTTIGRLVEAHGERLHPAGATARWGPPAASPTPSCLTHAFVTAEALAEIDPTTLPMPRSRARALTTALTAVADGRLSLDPGADRLATRQALTAIAGIGPWTADYVALRALGDPDVFLPTDIGVRNARRAAGLADDPTAARVDARRWRPWRSYALHHLWASL